MGKFWLRAAGLALAVSMAGCAGDATGPLGDLDATETALIAEDLDALTGGMVFDLFMEPGGFLVDAAPADTRTFDRSRACPAGGEITLTGTRERTRHGDGSVELTMSATGAWDACARERTRGERTVTTTVNGTFAMAAHRLRNNGSPVGNQTASKSGTFTWLRTDGTEVREGECTFDLTSVRNPDSRKVRITGTMCGREIDRETTWRSGT